MDVTDHHASELEDTTYFPFTEQGLPHYELLPISTLIEIAKVVDPTHPITKGPGLSQTRQRLAFITRCQECTLTYGMNQKASEALQRIQMTDIILQPTKYVATITSTDVYDSTIVNSIKVMTLDIPQYAKQYSMDMMDGHHSFHINTTITDQLEQSILQILNSNTSVQQQLPGLITTLPLMNITITPKASSPLVDKYNNNQLLTIGLAFARANGASIFHPTFDNLESLQLTIAAITEFTQQIQDSLVTMTTNSMHISTRSTVEKLININLALSNRLQLMSNNPHHHFDYNIPYDYILTVSDLTIINDHSQKIKFYKRTPDHFLGRYALLSHSLLTKTSVMQYLACCIITCDANTDGNDVGIMTYNKKINVDTMKIATSMESIIKNISSTVLKLPALNPSMLPQRQLAKEAALLDTKYMLDATPIYTHVCLAGIPASVDRSTLVLECTRLDPNNPGILKCLGFEDRSIMLYGKLIKEADAVLDIHHPLDRSTLAYQESTSNKAIMFPLIPSSGITSPYPMRSLTVSSFTQAKTLLSISFLTLPQATSMRTMVELISFRPIPEDMVSQLTKPLLLKIQRSTTIPITAILFSAPSRIQTDKKSTKSYREHFLVILGPNSLNEDIITSFRRSFNLSSNTTSTYSVLQSFLLQTVSNLKFFDWQIYPLNMRLPTTMKKFIVIFNIDLRFTAVNILEQLHNTTKNGHEYKLIFLAFLHHREPAYVAIINPHEDPTFLVNEMRAALSDMAIERECLQLESMSSLPGLHRSNILLNIESAITVTHPKTSLSVWSQTSSTKRTTQSSVSRIENSSTSSSSSGTKQPTLMNYYAQNTKAVNPVPSAPQR